MRAAAYALARPGTVVSPLVMTGEGRVRWSAEHADDDMFDVTELGHQYREFTDLRLLNRVTHCLRQGAVLVVEGRLVVPLGLLDERPALAARLDLSVRGGRAHTLSVPVRDVRQEGGGVVWRAELPLTGALRPRGIGDRVWDPRLVLTVDGVPVTTDLLADKAAVPARATALPARPLLTRLTADTWQPYVTAKHHLAVCLLPRRRAARTAQALAHYVTHFRPARKLKPVLRTLRKKREAAALPARQAPRVPADPVPTARQQGPRGLREPHGQVLRGQPARRARGTSRPRRRGALRLVVRHVARRVPRAGRGSCAAGPGRICGRWPAPSGGSTTRASRTPSTSRATPRISRRGTDPRTSAWGSTRRGTGRGTRRNARDSGARSAGSTTSWSARNTTCGPSPAPTAFPRSGCCAPATRATTASSRPSERDEREGRFPRPPLATELGIPDHRTVVLYAPTFRGVPKKGQIVQLPLDVREFAQRFGDTHVLLVRAHYMEAASLPVTPPGTVVDVSGHHDVSELLVLADVLITDYSSIMFDYALLDRPLVHFAPDLDAYAADRGTYFDLRERAGGPVIETQEELLRTLGGLKKADGEWQAARRAFAAEFGSYDDGGAARAAADLILGKKGCQTASTTTTAPRTGRDLFLVANTVDELGGVTAWTHQMARLFQGAGHRVHVIGVHEAELKLPLPDRPRLRGDQPLPRPPPDPAPRARPATASAPPRTAAKPGASRTAGAPSPASRNSSGQPAPAPSPSSPRCGPWSGCARRTPRACGSSA